jgi:hypothetical protein
MDLEDLITFKEASVILGCSPQNVHRIVKTGKLTIAGQSSSTTFLKRSDVMNYLDSVGIYRGKSPLSAVTVAEIVQRVKNGETMSAVAKEFKISTNKVYGYCLEDYKK